MSALNLFPGLVREVQEAEAFSLRLQAVGVPRESADRAYSQLAPGMRRVLWEAVLDGWSYDDAFALTQDTYASAVWALGHACRDLARAVLGELPGPRS